MKNERTITLSRNARLLLAGLLYNVQMGEHPNRDLAYELCLAFQSDDLTDEMVYRLSSSKIRFLADTESFDKFMINVDEVNLELSLEG